MSVKVSPVAMEQLVLTLSMGTTASAPQDLTIHTVKMVRKFAAAKY